LFTCLIESLFQTLAASMQILLKLLSIHDRMIGSIRLNQTGIHKKLGTIHQARFDTLPDDPFKKPPKGLYSPPGSGFA
jgi:hypothetical protein